MNSYFLYLNKTAPLILSFFALSLFICGMVVMPSFSSTLLEWHLMTLGATPLKMTLIMDHKGLLYASVVLFISANVMQFSKFYMADDKFINRFTILVILFVISMNLLIFIPHFMMLLLGWDGLGITSFILIIYYQNPKSLAAGMITALTNRIGDVMILMAIALTLNQGHWNIMAMWHSPFLWPQILMIVVAAMTKSAQMPFSSWLPAAMAAPTPVSALVHSSTLVTAGVFLLIRFYPFLTSSPMFHLILLFVAVSTMFMAGISATTECDMKKIIALSTLSQLGLMMTSLALGLPDIALFHMMTHALFKALLFICAGELIALHEHSQDLRWMGDLASQAPVASSCFFISNMALCGLPFMAGFYSKDLIMEFILINNFNLLMIFMSFISIGFTSFYSIRQSLVMLWSSRCYNPFHNMTEDYNVMGPTLNMSLMSISGGATMLWMLPANTPSLLPLSLKLLPLTMVLMGLLLGWVSSTSSWKFNFMQEWHLSNFASCTMWFLTPLSSQFQLQNPLKSSHTMLKTIDHGWLEWVSGQGMNSMTGKSSSILLNFGSSSPNAMVLKCAVAGLTLLLVSSLMY